MKDYNFKFKCPLCGCTTLGRHTTNITELAPVYGVEHSEHGCHHGLIPHNYDCLNFDLSETSYGCFECEYEADLDDMVKAGHLVLTEELTEQDYNLKCNTNE